MSTAAIVVSIILVLAIAAVLSRLSYIAEINQALLDEMKVIREALQEHRTVPAVTSLDTEEIEKRLDALLDHFGTSVYAFSVRRRAEAAERVRSFLAENPGQKITAIKLYRDATGEGLKESMAFVNSVMAERGDSGGRPVQS